MISPLSNHGELTKAQLSSQADYIQVMTSHDLRDSEAGLRDAAPWKESDLVPIFVLLFCCSSYS